MPLTTVSQGLLSTDAQYTGFKNRIINGAMMIDQRNAGASVTPTSDNTYTLDRWVARLSNASKFSVQQNAGSVTPPAGYTNYFGVTSLAATSVGSTDYYAIAQYIEGFNTADLAWGTANAQAVTLSFWVRSSLTGTFGGYVSNSSYGRLYPFSYTISSANTWEQKTVTIAGDTTGTWLTTNGAGIRIQFNLGFGSTYQGAANAWNSSSIFQPTGAVNLVSTNGATFYITGVQLEKGSTATSFDYRPYGTELALCQRYYETSYPLGAAVGSVSTVSVSQSSTNNGVATTSWITTRVDYKVTKRGTPTVSVWDEAANSGKITRFTWAVGTANNQNGGATMLNTYSFVLYSDSGTNHAGIDANWASSAEL